MTEKEKLLIYEARKAEIRRTSKSTAEYERRVKELARELGI